MNKTIGGFTFEDSQMLSQALTHSSYSENNYERLEFLGDSILDFLIADILFDNKKLKEAELTRARASLACEDNLSKVFDGLNLNNQVKLGKSCKVLTKAIKADIIESILACVYLQGGILSAKQFILDNFNLNVDDAKDYKTAFQEYAQKYRYNFMYKLDKTEGPAHKLVFYISLYMNDEKVAEAQGNSKLEAEKKCAKIALNKLTNK